MSPPTISPVPEKIEPEPPMQEELPSTEPPVKDEKPIPSVPDIVPTQPELEPQQNQLLRITRCMLGLFLLMSAPVVLAIGISTRTGRAPEWFWPALSVLLIAIGWKLLFGAYPF